MGGSGKGGDKNRRRFSRQNRGERSGGGGGRESRSGGAGRLESSGRSQSGKHSKKAADNLLAGEKFEKSRVSYFERPHWVPPKLNEEPIPIPDCPWCGKPIKDISTAVSDKNTGEAIHFDCVIARLSEGENLESGDAICYIGGGRFGVVHFGTAQNNKDFKIKKIFEWENKDDRSEWRRSISDHFSVT
jgi:hypothetical protein